MSAEKKVNRESKNIFARLLATEDITIRHDPSLSTAYFDVNKRILALPILENMDDDVYDLFVGHEVGHALYTPPFSEEEMLNVLRRVSPKNLGLAKIVLNMVEDARIEKAMRQKYPGLAKSFRFGYSKLWQFGFFGEEKEVQDKFSELVIIDRLNLHYKGTIYGIQHFVLSELDHSFVTRIDQTKTFEDIIPICIDILAHMNIKEEEEESKQEEKDSSMFSSNEPGNNPADREENEGSPNDDDENYDSSIKGEQGSSAGLKYQEGTSSLPNVSSTNDALEKYVEKINKESRDNISYLYNTLPTPNLEKIIVPYKRILKDFVRLSDEKFFWTDLETGTSVSYNLDAEYKEFLKKNNSACQSMSVVFKRKQQADVYRRTQIAKTGRLNMDQIHTYRYNDDLFLSSKIVPKGKNHGMIMYIDWSGSMGPNIAQTVEQLMNLVMFCRKSGIKYQVYAFTDQAFIERNQMNEESYVDFWENREEDSYRLSNFHLLDLFNSEMNNLENDIMMKSMLFISQYLGQVRRLHSSDYMSFNKYFPKYNLGGTPLNETIVSAISVEKNFLRKHNCQILNTVFLTDGEAGGIGFSYPAGFNYSYQNKRKYIIEHNCKSYEITCSYGNSKDFLRIFKDNTKGRLLGIYLVNNAYSMGYMIDRGQVEMESGKCKEDYTKFFKKNSYVEIKNNPYDFYYIMKSNAETVGFDDVFDSIDASKKNTEIVAQFVKSIKKRTSSRIILNKFAEVVAKDFRNS